VRAPNRAQETVKSGERSLREIRRHAENWHVCATRGFSRRVLRTKHMMRILWHNPNQVAPPRLESIRRRRPSRDSPEGGPTGAGCLALQYVQPHPVARSALILPEPPPIAGSFASCSTCRGWRLVDLPRKRIVPSRLTWACRILPLKWARNSNGSPTYFARGRSPPGVSGALCSVLRSTACPTRSFNSAR
jgi:hypothetical protein